MCAFASLPHTCEFDGVVCDHDLVSELMKVGTYPLNKFITDQAFVGKIPFLEPAQHA